MAESASDFSSAARFMIAGYEEMGEEHKIGGLQLKTVLCQYGETLASHPSRAAHGNLAHILIASEMSMFCSSRLYVLNPDATRITHVENYGETPPRMGLALIPETSQGSHGHFELVSIAGMERLIEADKGADERQASVGGNALVATSVGATSAEAVVAAAVGALAAASTASDHAVASASGISTSDTPDVLTSDAANASAASHGAPPEPDLTDRELGRAEQIVLDGIITHETLLAELLVRSLKARG